VSGILAFFNFCQRHSERLQGRFLVVAPRPNTPPGDSCLVMSLTLYCRPGDPQALKCCIAAQISGAVLVLKAAPAPKSTGQITQPFGDLDLWLSVNSETSLSAANSIAQYIGLFRMQLHKSVVPPSCVEMHPPLTCRWFQFSACKGQALHLIMGGMGRDDPASCSVCSGWASTAGSSQASHVCLDEWTIPYSRQPNLGRCKQHSSRCWHCTLHHAPFFQVTCMPN
jgi:hypothetical protein